MSRRHDAAFQRLSKAWLLLAFGDERQHEGNDGYLDDPARSYRYDSFVPNSRQIQEGDLALIRDRSGLLGLGRIVSITREENQRKTVRRCPSCTKTTLKRRRSLSPAYRCHACKRTFDAPVEEEVTCTTFEARFGSTFTPTPGALTLEDLKEACPAYNGNLAMQKLEVKRLRDALLSAFPAVEALLDEDDDHLEDAGEQGRTTANLQADEAENAGEIDPALDLREVVSRQILARRGQSMFREALRRRFGDRCAVSGCDLIDLLEAAHIMPYRGAHTQVETNGLLLRADIHTLFDLDLMGIRPFTLEVQFHPAAKAAGYDMLHGRRLRCPGGPPDERALQLRWSRYVRRLRMAR